MGSGSRRRRAMRQGDHHTTKQGEGEGEDDRPVLLHRPRPPSWLTLFMLGNSLFAIADGCLRKSSSRTSYSEDYGEEGDGAAMVEPSTTSPSHKLPCLEEEIQRTRCLNGGECFAIPGTNSREAHCVCPDEWEGRRCEQVYIDIAREVWYRFRFKYRLRRHAKNPQLGNYTYTHKQQSPQNKMAAASFSSSQSHDPVVLKRTKSRTDSRRPHMLYPPVMSQNLLVPQEVRTAHIAAAVSVCVLVFFVILLCVYVYIKKCKRRRTATPSHHNNNNGSPHRKSTKPEQLHKTKPNKNGNKSGDVQQQLINKDHGTNGATTTTTHGVNNSNGNHSSECHGDIV